MENELGVVQETGAEEPCDRRPPYVWPMLRRAICADNFPARAIRTCGLHEERQTQKEFDLEEELDVVLKNMDLKDYEPVPYPTPTDHLEHE